MLSDKENAENLRIALGVLLGDMDWTAGACGLTEMVSAVVKPQTLDRAHAAMKGEKYVVG